MCHLLESIKVENGVLHRLPYHEQRMQHAQQALLGQITTHSLADQIKVPTVAQQGLYKCRVIYHQAIEHIEFVPYQSKTIRTLRRIRCDYISYNHKYEDRRLLNELFAQRAHCDDVLIIKNGRVTDTSYANIAFYDGQDWVTPDRPLLRGTQRQYLLECGLLRAVPIREEDILSFQGYQVINALRELSDTFLPVSYIL